MDDKIKLILALISWIEWIVLMGLMAILFYLSIPVNTPKKITIPKDATHQSILSQLSSDGYPVSIIDSWLFAPFGKIKSGEVRTNKKVYSRIDLLHMLTKAKPPLYKITLIPGETTEIFLLQVAHKLDINQSRLLEAYKTYAKYPEAAIAADTYLAPKKINETKLIKYLLSSSERRYAKLSKAYFGDYNQTRWLRTLIIASIIQKEAANDAEMPIISSVIQNRLDRNIPLQMDGTLNYGRYSHIKVTPQRIREDQSTFNTYKHKGLPLYPVGSVSTAAIKAAINPAKTDYLYFVRNKKTKRHDFSKTFNEHRKNIQKSNNQTKIKAVKY